jgi:hypothetical protein
VRQYPGERRGAEGSIRVRVQGAEWREGEYPKGIPSCDQLLVEKYRESTWCPKARRRPRLEKHSLLPAQIGDSQPVVHAHLVQDAMNVILHRLLRDVQA